jgi:hypothetical protein
MAGLSRLTAQESPAAVSVHIDRDVESVSAAARRLFGIPPSPLEAASDHEASMAEGRREVLTVS